MADKKDLSTLPQFLKPEVAEHFKDGMFEFDFAAEEHIAVEGNTVYHVLPHYASDGAESVLNKLRRMIAKNLEEM